jgi:hypothetical protein
LTVALPYVFLTFQQEFLAAGLLPSVAKYSLSDVKDEHFGQFVLFAHTMKAMTGQRDVLATPLLLRTTSGLVGGKKNAGNNEFIGWESPA